MSYPLGNVWPVGDSKTNGVTDPPGSCGPRDPIQAALAALGGTFVGTLTGGADGAGGVLTPCPISGLALAGDGHNGFHCSDVTANLAGWFASIAGTPPKLGVFYVGTNDLIAIATSAPGFTIDRLYNDYRTCLQTAIGLSASLPWLVCNMDPMPNLYTLPFFYQFNAFILAQVQTYQRQGKPVYLVDLYSALQPTENPTPGAYYNSGGVHQTTSPGYSATGNAMAHTMRTLAP